MHEWALAEGVISTALEEADREGLVAIERVEVVIGELQRIKKETFEFAIAEVLPRDQPRLEGADITLEIEPAAFRCRGCTHEFGYRDVSGALGPDEGEAVHFVPELAHAFLECPSCGSPDFEVVRGRGVWIREIRGRVEDAT